MRYWPQSCLCHIQGRLDGKVALVTDGPSFMGVEVAAELARRGATVYIGCQSAKHFNTIKETILRLYGQAGERTKFDFADEQVLKYLTPVKESQVSCVKIPPNNHKTEFSKEKQCPKLMMVLNSYNSKYQVETCLGCLFSI